MSRITINKNVINQLSTPSLITDLIANRPATAANGVVFFAKDTTTIEQYISGSWITYATGGAAGVSSIIGTTNQVIASAATGNVTLSLPQSIATSSNVTFATITGTSFIKSGGTSSQFLKGDGSVDSNTYLTTSSAASTYLPLIGGTLTGTLIGTGIVLTNGITASSFNTIGGTASQFLKANGTLDSNTYLTTSSASSTYLPLAGGTLTGALSGTSASFSGDITTTNSNGQVHFIDAANTNYQWSLQGYSSQFRLYNNNTSTTVLNFASTGAATFASTVTATGATLTGALSGTTITTSGKVAFGNTNLNEQVNIDGGASADEFIRFDKSGAFQGLVGIAQTAGHGSSLSVAGDNIIRSQTNVLLDLNGTTLAKLSSTSFNIYQTTASTSYTTGALVVAGGIAANAASYFNTSITTPQVITGVFWPNAGTFNSNITISPSTSNLGMTVIANDTNNYTWTLESCSGQNRMYVLRAIGTGIITVNRGGSDTIISNAGSSVTSLTLTAASGAVILQSDGTSRWIQIK